MAKRKDPKRVKAGRKAALKRQVNEARRSAAARKGWEIRRNKVKPYRQSKKKLKSIRRSDAALKGWETRRAKAKEKKKWARGKPNREYLVTFIRGGKKKKGRSPLPPKPRFPDFVAVYDANASNYQVVAFIVRWIETERDQDEQWWINVIYHALGTGRLVVARHPKTTNAPQGVKLR